MDKSQEFAHRGLAAQKAVDEILPCHRDAESEVHIKMRNALELVLLWHSGGYWDKYKDKRWKELTGDRAATSRVLCDCVSEALKETRPDG